ncbi:hypothetical protein LPC08_22250 [Roseomonas sp. OT10]|uniref:hypothetical protein n=1 Tax=Roseomonas cutis TaxID=2897332 RepID=UPI001E390257|nr:hypothetical protein [Roseomonas sp. OT10]UFN48701.1 hypothetical protein LPC08_22250 [Roseomonas sp. OT10]
MTKAPRGTPEALPPATLSLEAMLPGEGGLLLLSARPGDEIRGCGGLLAAMAAAGRPVRVVIATDGQGQPALRRRQAVEGLAALGLGAGMLVLLGQPAGGVPEAGPGFAAMVTVVAGLLRREAALDTLLLPPGEAGDRAALRAMGLAAAAGLGLRRLGYALPGEGPPGGGEPGARRLDLTGWRAARDRAMAAHGGRGKGPAWDSATWEPPAWESYIELPPG